MYHTSNYSKQRVQRRLDTNDVLMQIDGDSDSELSEIASDDDDVHDVYRV